MSQGPSAEGALGPPNAEFHRLGFTSSLQCLKIVPTTLADDGLKNTHRAVWPQNFCFESSALRVVVLQGAVVNSWVYGLVVGCFLLL